MTIRVRAEQAGDEAAIRQVNDAAFGQPNESRIIDALRAAGRIVVSLVAIDQAQVVGHILFTPVAIESSPVRALGLGPMAVAPAFQRHGIGSTLVTEGLRECERLGYGAVVVIGHPEFYPRFGFRRASRYGLRPEFDVDEEAFMVTELSAGALDGVTGLVKYAPEFASV
jgi:putative acetyltransferase